MRMLRGLHRDVEHRAGRLKVNYQKKGKVETKMAAK